MIPILHIFIEHIDLFWGGGLRGVLPPTPVLDIKKVDNPSGTTLDKEVVS